MPSVSATVQPIGPIVRLAGLVSDPRRAALVAASRPVPNPILINGLLDTGASSTCIDPAVMQALGLTPTGFVPIVTPSTGSTPHMCEQYDVSIAIRKWNCLARERHAIPDFNRRFRFGPAIPFSECP